ncbi:MAG: TolC family protein, partial [Azonexus sp.]|nr:TolC family protein [Azonexus sp.]
MSLMKNFTLVALLVSAAFPVIGQVSPVPTAVPATLKEVAQRAVLNSPEVTSKWHAYRAADEEIGVARGGYLPRVDLTAGSGRESLRQPTTADRDYTRTGVMLSLNQMLFDGF